MTQAHEQQNGMKVRKYFAADMRSALEMVRAQQGPDVLILSNRQLDDGIELITADDSVDKQVLQSLQTQNKTRNSGRDRKTEVNPSVRQLKKYAESGSRQRDQIGSRENKLAEQSTSEYKNVDTFSGQAGHENLLWTDENTIRQMQVEMHRIKALLEQQLSGLAWSDYAQKFPQRARLLRTLNRVGIVPELAKSLVQQVEPDLDTDKAWQFVVNLLRKNIKVLSDPILSHGGQVAICGPTGVGKTTLVCKLAARYARQYGADAVTIISLDDHRLGAHQQLKVFARLSGVECVVPKNDREFQDALDKSAANDSQHLSLIDTSGFAPDDIRFRECLSRLNRVSVYFAISATTDYAALKKVLDVCAEIDCSGCILTKTDEAAQLGAAISALIKAKLPLAYISNGQTVPDDLDLADAKHLTAQALAIAAIDGRPANDLSIETAFAQISQG